ncbi:YegS/Rv2252/BmrU family lipid kinase [Clostridium frigidicarnis]|uniref:Lipid kinase, YegS/Rv2252/BmrU family n=1 Tax=Clostridium frigidicarnis TaxID=84698 RepID=A0A1I1ADW3_9CLOT|nr:YegS/Rv2252/BmrU family lipid kinase [Clostridium frigidicarnis]SFB36191.1 lipid kinase, YegS/Rv2252/BmrU family [Clostridium frigidicarnis]
MKKVKFIYNPFSGENAILNDIDTVIKMHQLKGYIVVPHRISFDIELGRAFDDIDEYYEYIIVAGGDGTVDTVVNLMKELNIDLPIAILPVGTANDFAKFIGISPNVEKACHQILNSNPVPIDIGRINDKYFINVASTGLFTDVSQKTDVNLKNTIGKLAYYIKGLEQLPNFRKLRIKVESNHFTFDDDMYLTLVFNGQTAGNFKLAYNAHVEDGALDVIIIKACAIRELIPLFIRILKGEHLEDPNVVYFKTDKLVIQSNESIVTDIDGEKGPDFPLNIECIKGGIKVLGIK